MHKSVTATIQFELNNMFALNLFLCSRIYAVCSLSSLGREVGCRENQTSCPKERRMKEQKNAEEEATKCNFPVSSKSEIL